MTATDHLTTQTYAERERIVALLADIAPHQWAAPSLCDGWQVREVVAHLTMPFRTGLPQLLAGLIRARLSFDRCADRDARAVTATMSDATILELLRENIRHPWRPPGGGQAGALGHDVIHGLDITEPLGLPGPPPSRIARVLEHAGPRNLKFFGVDLAGHRLVADDADVSIGEGTPRRMPAKDVLLVVTGRRDLPDVPGSKG